MKKTFYLGVISKALVMGFGLAVCGSSPASAQEAAPIPGAAVAENSPAVQGDYGSSWLVGKWLSLSTGFVDELILLKDGTGTSTLYKGSGEAGMAMKLTFNSNDDFFGIDPAGVGKTIPIKYSRSEDGTRLTIYMPGTDGLVYAREEQVIKEVSAGEDVTAILRLGSYYSVAGNANCIALFTEAANRGVSDGNLNLGNHYYKTDEAKAFEYYLKAAEQGNAQAEYNVFVFYYNGGGGVTKDSGKAVEWLMKAAKHGSADAARVMKQLAGQS